MIGCHQQMLRHTYLKCRKFASQSVNSTRFPVPIAVGLLVLGLNVIICQIVRLISCLFIHRILMNKWNLYKVRNWPQEQPKRLSWWDIVGSLLVYGIIIYVICSFFRRGTPAKDATGGMGPYTNIYSKDTIMVRYIILDWLMLQL